MTDHTAETLAIWRTSPFSYARGHDCLMSLADHVRRVTGIDHGFTWRGRYETESEAWAFVQAYGGPVAMINASGLPHTSEPGRGDILVAECGGKLLGALHTGDSIAFRMHRGVIEIKAKMIVVKQAWKVC